MNGPQDQIDRRLPTARDSEVRGSINEGWYKQQRRQCCRALRRALRNLFRTAPRTINATPTPWSSKTLASRLAKHLGQAEKIHGEVQQLEREVRSLDGDLASTVASTTTLIAQDETKIAGLLKTRNAAQVKLRTRCDDLHEVHTEIETIFKALDAAVRARSGSWHLLHQLRTLCEAAHVLRLSTETVHHLQERLGTTEMELRDATSRSTVRKLQKTRDQIAQQLATEACAVDASQRRELALQRTAAFYGSQLVQVTRSLKLIAKRTSSRPGGTRIMTRRSAKQIGSTLPSTRVQREYHLAQKAIAEARLSHLAQKALAEAKLGTMPPVPAVDAASQKEWTDVQRELVKRRYEYYHYHSHAFYLSEYKRQDQSGEIALETAFGNWLVEDLFPLAFEDLTVIENEFQEVQRRAMRAGLEPAHVSSDLAFSSHPDDSIVDSEAPANREAGKLLRYELVNIGCWNLKIPLNEFYRGAEKADIPSIVEWDGVSVGLGSSRSQWDNMGTPPSTFRKRKINEHQKEQGRWRAVAEVDYRERTGRLLKSQ